MSDTVEKDQPGPSVGSKSVSAFNKTFYIANGMEVFERLAWYGFFTVSSLYMTSPVDQGGMGFSDQQRGVLQGIIPFLLYLFPVITGALADRYGFRRMFLLSFLIMTPSYYALGQVTSFWSFFLMLFMVAVGAAIFKPLVVGTVARSTDDSNRGLGFGIFYMVVNIGGFLGPLAAGYVRAISWDMVFVMSATWIALNFIPALFFFKDDAGEKDGNLKDVLKGAQDVLGNGRFALTVAVVILSLMMAGGGWISYTAFFILSGLWLAAQFVWNGLTSPAEDAPWYRQKMKVGNGKFVLYLLILSGFWAAYQQIFITMPLYIRDFVDTSDLVQLIGNFSPGLLDFLATVNVDQIAKSLTVLAASTEGTPVRDIYFQLVNQKIMVPENVISEGLSYVRSGGNTALLAQHWAEKYRQINPEYIISLDFGSIILFQYMVSRYGMRFRPFTILIAGTLLIAGGYVMGGMAHALAYGGLLSALSVVVFAFGEMLASPKSQEYVAILAPKDKPALFMGYYFVSMAIGFLLAGILSGWAYGTLAKEMGEPLLMWALFAAVAVITAVVLYLFDRKVAHHG